MHRVGVAINSWHHKCTLDTLNVLNVYGLSSADAAVPASTVHCTNACVWALACLQEIRCCCSGWDDSFRVGHCSEQFGLSRVSVFEDHDGGYVATAVAVVGSWPHGYQLLIEHELVALVDELMGPADQLQVVDVDELQFFKERNERRKGGGKKMITIPKQGCSNPVLLPWTNSSEKLILQGKFLQTLQLCHSKRGRRSYWKMLFRKKIYFSATKLYKQVNSVSLQLFTWYRSPHVRYIIYIKLNLTRPWHAVSFTSTSNTGVHVHPATVACWYTKSGSQLTSDCSQFVSAESRGFEEAKGDSSLWIQFSSWPYCCGSAWSLPFVRGREYR